MDFQRTLSQTSNPQQLSNCYCMLIFIIMCVWGTLNRVRVTWAQGSDCLSLACDKQQLQKTLKHKTGKVFQFTISLWDSVCLPFSGLLKSLWSLLLNIPLQLFKPGVELGAGNYISRENFCPFLLSFISSLLSFKEISKRKTSTQT